MSAKFPSLKNREHINKFQHQTGYIFSRESCENLIKNIHSYQIFICTNLKKIYITTLTIRELINAQSKIKIKYHKFKKKLTQFTICSYEISIIV